MSQRQTRDPEPWQRLLTSADTHHDLCNLFPAAFVDSFATRFDRAPHPIEIFRGVIETGHAYVRGKWLKQAEKSKLLQYSGVHMMGAGVAARQLAASLNQLTKSDLANQMVSSKLAEALDADPGLTHGRKAYVTPNAPSGPQSQLATLHQLAIALEDGISQIIALPSEDDDADAARERAFDFVDDVNGRKVKVLSKYFAIEEAARAFQPLWERHSTTPFIRGRYHETGGYDCAPGRALHQIVRKLDSTVAESLAGTAIENIR
ncbi:hypothetical protein [Loktanella sp. SALINAS62]|uniref:hypothetical protein n=1 Tax=Loktanella sp. SALINAS62 TaxID=2706124 RepID=UPI001B8B5CF7|nr:hypothetical protein [Loktanella sp. SALINAS62]MBS1302147.1 hypothetical protein [Loktanella sp. SALINAS62]